MLLFRVLKLGNFVTASITQLLNLLRQGEEKAANELVNRFLPRLRKRLSRVASQLQMSDEDDIAISAFYELCIALENSRFEDISDRTELWQVLSMIAMRKANDFRKIENAEKRGGRQKPLSIESFKHQVASFDDNPELQVEMLEMCEHFLNRLKEEDLRSVALLKMNGYTNADVSQKLGIATRTVQVMVAKLKKTMLAILEQDHE